MKAVSTEAKYNLRGFLLPLLAAVGALLLAFIGALLTDSVAGGLNARVEGFSSSSGSILGNVGAWLPLGFAFGAGMVSSVNPCGFAMLPAYLGLYTGSIDDGKKESIPVLSRLAKALLVGGTVTAGFIILFGVVGLAIGVGARQVVTIFPWIGLSIGIVLAFAGAWLLRGGKIYSGLMGRAASHIGDPNRVSVRGYFLFGISYGTASLSCTLPIFLAVVGTSFATGGVFNAGGQFIVYGLGMGVVIIALTLGMTVFKTAMVGALRKALPYIQPVSAALMILAGAYIVFYWLTIGGLLST